MKPLLPALLLSAAAALPARAGEAACWYENGVVVVTAEVAGFVGDFILDTGQARTQLAETQALEMGYVEPEVLGRVTLAGSSLPALPIAVADLDVRTGLFPTPIAGVIGADALRGQVVDVSFAPCRVRLSAPGRAPRFQGRTLPLAWAEGRPVVMAGAADGRIALRGPFVPSTGLDAPVRLSSDFAAVPGAAKPDELLPYGVLRPRLALLSFGDALTAAVPAGLTPPAPDAIAGVVGAPVLDRWRLRFDFPAGELRLAPAP
ncbi:hypothetical protein [Phenylobacterium sp.]|uniref:hypothetical protein n=1 Tax=Phenylobacterium sp. TaxID=1871053 RepID=UPI002F95B4C4